MSLVEKRASAPSIAEHDMVHLLGALTYEGLLYPPGSVGTVVYRHADGATYEVEFERPAPAVVTLRDTEVALAGG